MLDRLFLEQPPVAIGDPRHGWIKDAAYVLTLNGEPYTLTGAEYNWLVGFQHCFQGRNPAPPEAPRYTEKAVLLRGFLHGRAIGVWDWTASYWYEDGLKISMSVPTGCWLYSDADGNCWRATFVMRENADASRTTGLLFERFGIFDLDNPQPADQVPKAGYFVWWFDADRGKDYWAESVSLNGDQVCGYHHSTTPFFRVAWAYAIQGVPGEPGFDVAGTYLIDKVAGTDWETLSGVEVVNNCTVSMRRRTGDTKLYGGAPRVAELTRSLSTFGGPQDILITPAGAPPASGSLTHALTYTVSPVATEYRTVFTVEDAFTVTSATETEIAPGTWQWEIHVDVHRTVTVACEWMPEASYTSEPRLQAQLYNNGPGRLADASVAYTFNVPNYAYNNMAGWSGVPKGANYERYMLLETGWQGYGGDLLGTIEKVADTNGAWARYRRSQMVGTEILISRSALQTAPIDATRFVANPCTGELMEVPAGETYKWAGVV